MTETLDALWQAVEQSPDDWDRYLVLADALNDAGEERLERAVRWMVKEGKRPEDVSFLARLGECLWCWFDGGKFGNYGPEKLPKELFKGHGGYGAKTSKTLLAAVSWLADQLERGGL